jgi:amino acid adenylation domain-containing protein
MDGRGVLHWIKDIFRVLRKEPPQGAFSEMTEDQLLFRLQSQLQSKKIKRKLDFNSSFPLSLEPKTGQSFFWKRRTIPGIHPALVAKLASLISEFSGQDRVQFMVPVDLRHHDSKIQSTANLSLPIFLKVNRGDRWELVHEQVLRRLAEKEELSGNGTEWALSRVPLWGVEQFVRVAIGLQRRRKKYMASGILSHLGKIKLSDFSFLGFKAQTVYSLPVHTGLIPLSLVAVECDDHVELTLSCAEGQNLERETEELLDRIVQSLTTSSSLRWKGSRSAHTFPRDKTVIEFFHDQVKATPKNIALSCSTRSMTYEILDRHADHLGHLLRGMGVGVGSIVGLLSDRTEDAVIGILGILKSGAAYLPIDPDYPDERIAFMLEDAKAQVCVTQSHFKERLKHIFAGDVLTRDHLKGDFKFNQISPLLELTAKPSDLLYVIYTSGSTGKPKGVQIEHRSLVNYAHWAIESYQINASSRFALFTSLSFDLTATSIFLPLLKGGSLELFTEELSHLTLAKVVESGRINSLKLTPTHLGLIEALNLNPIGIRILVVGGEQLKFKVASRAQELFGPECQIVNEYGPTETTIGCVTHIFDALALQASAAVPIGLPIKNTNLLLMDAEGNEVRPEQVGELWIGGDGLARGYLHREDLNREKFVFLREGQRFYKTGDLARVLTDGNLEFLGRKDHQLKIRGYRIEPGEIETVLNQHPDIANSVVLGVLLPNQPEPILCGYFVPKGLVNDTELRIYLKTKLPHYLIPNHLIAVDRIPVTVHGKVDIQALPSVGMTDGVQANLFRPQFDEIESKGAQVWARVLKLDAEGFTLESHFHALGGDSLKMVEMLSLISKILPKENGDEDFMNRMRLIVQNPTFENVCRSIRRTLEIGS